MTLVSAVGACFAVLAQPATAIAANSNAVPVRAIFMTTWQHAFCGRDSRTGSVLRRRTAPAGQIIGIHAAPEFQRLFDGALEVALDRFTFHAPAQEIRPDEFAERRRILGETAGAPQFARQRAERLVEQTGHRFWNI